MYSSVYASFHLASYFWDSSIHYLSSLFFVFTQYYSTVWAYRNLFMHFSIDEYLDYFQAFLFIYKAVIYEQLFLWTYPFVLLGKYIAVWLSGHRVGKYLNLSTTCFQMLNSHQQWVRVLVAPHSCQHLAELVLILTILDGISYLIVVLLFISPMTNDEHPFICLLIVLVHFRCCDKNSIVWVT